MKIGSNGLGDLLYFSQEKSKAVNAENPNGLSGKGGMSASALGKSRKGSPCISLVKGQETVLMEVQGSGVIKHIWITVTDRTERPFVLRNLVLRMYWDDEVSPSVEAPLGDFFCNGFGKKYNVVSIPVAVNPYGGMNCYFQMPFRKKAKITVENQHSDDIPHFFYQIDYVECEVPVDVCYFHAQWRRQAVTEKKKDYVVLDDVKGKGHYVGTFLSLAALERYWWGEGEVKFYIDDDEEFPTICGTGLEDYFLGSWAFSSLKDNVLREETFNAPYSGYPYFSDRDDTSSAFDNRMLPERAFYRWHILDPIRFEKGLKVTIQQIGLDYEGLFERSDDYSTVAYWYQSEPHNKFTLLPSCRERRPR